MVSPLTTGSFVSPSSKLTSAAISKVHRLLSLANFLGERWSISRKAILGALLVERPTNGVRVMGTPSERLRKTLFVEFVDRVGRGLGVTAEVGGDPVSILAPVAGEQDLAAAQGEGIRRANPASRVSRSASLKGRT